ncbi:MAG: UDP-glucose 4-epimerase GalE [Prevotellaceae bacterium]|jgi:UDP-glucose 4-epimerase|nr:UDP-glucose 4-epimerase GalE [Prevotellaceae bacterium]
MPLILVTGGAGYIGSHTVTALQQAGFETIIVDDLSNSTIDVLDGIARITGIRPHFEQVDCCDKPALAGVFDRYPAIAAVIHFAASKSVGESVDQPLKYYHNNLQSLIRVLDEMMHRGIAHFVFSSSCTIYGQPDKLPVAEDEPAKPAMSPYGNTKQIGEEIIRDVAASGGALQSILLRYFNPIGAHPSAEIGELPVGVPQNLVPFITQTAAGIRKELNVFGNDYNTPDGSCIRDYINVVDLARAHVRAVNYLLEGKNTQPVEAFNIGTGRGLSVLELIRLFQQATGVALPYKIVGRRAGDIEQVWANPQKANDVLGWQATETIEDTLRAAWKWELRIRNRPPEAVCNS